MQKAIEPRSGRQIPRRIVCREAQQNYFYLFHSWRSWARQ
jgi:hypothetical protein